MKFVIKKIFVYSKWFDLKGKGKDQKSLFSSNITVDGLLVYLILHKFYMIGQDEKFILTSVNMLSEESGLDENIISGCLIMMEKAEVIKIRNRSRRNNLLDENGCLRSDTLLNIVLTDVPDYKNNKDDKFVLFETDMVCWMLDNSLSGKHIAAYHLLKKYSQGGNREVDYDTDYLGKHVGIPKTTMLRLFDDLNDKMIIKSMKKNNGKGGKKFIHHVLWEYGRWNVFKGNHYKVK